MNFFHGVRTVASQEFRIRLRAGRWRILLAVWFIVLVVFTALVTLAFGINESNNDDLGVPVFGIVILFVTGLLLLVVPTLTSQSINGDRERGTLATLQVTLLSPLHIATGKLLAAWGVALVFLLLALPPVLFTLILGGTSITRFVVVILVDAVLLGVYCAIAQGISSLLARSTTSSVLSYVAVFTLTIGTLIAFALSAALLPDRTFAPTQTQVDTYNQRLKETNREYAISNYTVDQLKTTEPDFRLVWWMIAINPFALLSDSAPALPLQKDRDSGEYYSQPTDVLGTLGTYARLSRGEGEERFAYLTDPKVDQFQSFYDANQRTSPPIWTWGLLFNVLIAAGFFIITVRRLRTPVDKLSRGQRIA